MSKDPSKPAHVARVRDIVIGWIIVLVVLGILGISVWNDSKEVSTANQKVIDLESQLEATNQTIIQLQEDLLVLQERIQNLEQRR